MRLEDAVIRTFGDEKEDIAVGKSEPYLRGIGAMFMEFMFKYECSPSVMGGCQTLFRSQDGVMVNWQSTFLSRREGISSRHENIFTVIGPEDSVNKIWRVIRRHSESHGYVPLGHLIDIYDRK